MQLNSTAHHSSPQSDDAQPMSPVAPIGSLGLLLHGSAGCQKFDGFTLRVTDRRFVQLPPFILFYSLPPRSFPKVFCWLWRIGMPLAIWETTRVIFMRTRTFSFYCYCLFLLSIPFALNSYFIQFIVKEMYMTHSHNRRPYDTLYNQRVNSAGSS